MKKQPDKGKITALYERLSHDGCKCDGQFVWTGKTEAQCQRTLRVCVYQQNPFASLRQTDTEICARRCLSHAAFLVGNSDCMCHFEVHLLNMFIDNDTKTLKRYAKCQIYIAL